MVAFAPQITPIPWGQNDRPRIPDTKATITKLSVEYFGGKPIAGEPIIGICQMKDSKEIRLKTFADRFFSFHKKQNKLWQKQK